MKKLISLIFVALISSQMWAAMVYAHYYTGSNNTMGKIGINMSSSWPTTSAPSSGYVYVSGSSTNVRLNAEALSGYTFGGWYDETGALISSSAQYLWTYGSHTGSSKGAYAKFTATGGGSGSGGGSGTSQTKNYTVSGTNYTMNAYDLNTGDNILWGDRAVGATSTTTAGFFCQYGYTDLSASNYCNSSNSYSGVFTNTSNLPADKDVATAALGEGWRMPTRTEWNTLISKSTFSCASTTGNNVVLTANSKTITLYTADKKYNGSVSYSATSSSAYAYYWTGTRESGTDAYRAKFSKSTTASNITKTTDDTWWVYGQQVIPVYDAANYTLTVKADGTTSTNYSGKWGATQSVTASKTGKVFKRWNDGNTSNPRTFKICNITYTAEFEDPKVTATFKNYDGTTLYTNSNVTSGTTPTYGGSTPTKPSTEEYDYTFNDWSPALGNITSNTTYTATFTAVPKVVNVTATFNDHNGDEIDTESVQSGSAPTASGITVPDYTADGYTYKFNGTWSPALGAITSDETYTAQYDKYVTATFQNEAGETVGSILVRENTAPSDADGISGITGPAKTGTTDGYTYTFDTWKTSADVLYTVAITDHTTYLPAYTRVARELTLLDKGSDDYYQGIADVYYDENTPVYLRKITYNRSFPALKWSTFSLPFNWTIDEDSPLDGIVYSFDGATGDYTSLNVSFSAGVTEIEAGVPYLLYPTEKIDNLVFDLDDTESNTQLYLTDAIIDGGDAVSVTVGTGQVTFSATNRGYTLYGQTKNDAVNETWKDYLFLSNNRLYYPNRNGNTLYAFRAFFHVNSGAGVAPRMRITANGQTIEIDEADANTTDEQSAARVRKTIENGVLIIERNGNRYNAQGAMIQ